MSNTSYPSYPFLEAKVPRNPNSNHLSNYAIGTDFNHQNFEPFDLMLAEELENDFASIFTELHQEVTSNNTILTIPDVARREESGGKGIKSDERTRIAFRTKSWVEIMDDGFKWRKYGKKIVKNSPNPRNYYKCSKVGCNVKKRVERDREDSNYVITTYEGVHNHEALQ